MEAGEEVEVLSLNTKKHFYEVEKLPEIFRQLKSFEAVSIDTEVTPWGAFKNIFTQESYNIQRFYAKEFEEKLVAMLTSQEFDVIHLEGLHISIYLDTIRKHSKAKIVLRAHNLEYLIWERLAAAEGNPLKKYYVNLLAKRMQNYEVALLNKVDAIVPITTIDEGLFRDLGCTKPMLTSPTGLEVAQYKIDLTKTDWGSVFHLGAMNWLPNIQAVEWFMENCWEGIHQANPTANCHIAGRNVKENLHLKPSPNIIVEGEVQDAMAFMNSHGIMIVPLQSGSGMRIKIIEGMAMGKAIVSTTIGAEGIECTHGKNILIADSPKGFAAAVNLLLANKTKAEELGNNARLLAEEKYDNTASVQRVLGFYQKLITNNRQPTTIN